MSNNNKKHTILIVDDTAENLDVLKRTLIDEYLVRPAINGPLALRLARLEPQPDLILLDIMMPDMDGYEVCRQLKRDINTQDIPIIFVTAKTGDADEIEGFEMGAVDYITKPISPYIVKARIKTQLALRNFNNDMEEKNRRLYEINEKLTDSLEKLSSSEERFRGLVQTIPDIVYKIDSEGNFTFLNKSVERLGYHQSDLIGKHFSEIIHSADVPNASLDKVIERIGKGTSNPEQKVFDERRSGERMTVGLEVRLKTKSGKPIGVSEIKNIDDHSIGVEVNSTGLYGEVAQQSSNSSRQYVGTVGVIRDVTDRQKAQKAFTDERLLLRQLIDSVPLPIFYMQNSGRVLFSNSAFQKFSGADIDKLESTQITNLFDNEGNKKLQSLLSDILADNSLKKIQKEIDLKSSEGLSHSVNVILSEFQKTGNTEADIIGVLVDITEQKAFTQKLVETRNHAQEMAQKAKHASQAKGDFLANMSHEIRTPLNAVIGLTHLSLQTDLSFQQRDYLNKVSLSANALLTLINDILDFSKIEAGKLSLEKVTFSLDDLLASVAAILSIKSQEKGLELLLDIEPNIPLSLEGDPHRLRQILTNLIGNAVKFTQQGEIVLSVELVEENPDDIMLQFIVRDTGIGMTQEQLGNLFKEFSQGDASTTRKYGGTGLGLTISKRLVELMGGQISVESEDKKGSKFIFTSRFKRLEQTETKQIIIEENIRDLHILVVDDNNTSRRITSIHLESLGYHPTTVSSGEAAIETLSTADADGLAYDLVLMDWKMPGINGLETTRRIKNSLSLTKVPKIVMVTSFGPQEVVPTQEEKDLLEGFLMKPITIATLSDAILTAFGHKPMSHLTNNTNESVTSDLAGVKLLLVEDNEINQQVACELLQQINIQVTLANNGEEAVELANNKQFDGILMDLQMPVMDGLEATKQIRLNEKLLELPIIAMTANAMVGDREKCLKVGMNDHVGKPVVPKELYSTLVKWIEKKPGDYSSQNITPPKPRNSDNSMVLIPALPGIDTNIGLRNVGNNCALYKKVLLKFVKNQGNSCLKLAEHIGTGDYQALEQTAHALKGVSSTIGAKNLAKLAGTIEKLAQKQDSLTGLSDIIGETTTELANISHSINTSLVLEKQTNTQNQEITDVGPEVLTPLFKKAVKLLNDFDSAVEKVVDEIVPLVSSEKRIERIKSIKKPLESYDFVKCLSIFQEWAAEEGIELQETTHE
ncbi:MAG: response regulator [Magnetococcales bacterium]|nr:response regulator [Magnetococcales bacterium]